MTVFLFAHQDDEFGVYSEIESVVESGGRPICIFVTDGAGAGADPLVRNAESRSVLAGMGVRESDLHFLGSSEGFPDGRLVAHLDRAAAAIDRALAGAGPVARLIMHAWEGGHQDHDAVHLLGLALAKRRTLLGSTWQFPLYRRRPSSILPFVLFDPIAEYGAVEVRSICWRRRISYLRRMFKYRSQLKTMMVLWPVAAKHMLVTGKQFLQPVDCTRVRQAPHAGQLLYESRGAMSYGEFSAYASEFCKQRLAS